MSQWLRLTILLMVGFFIQGCATSRGIIDTRVAPMQAEASGKPVVIVAVNDLRQFELKPNKPSIPSLKDGNITDKAITSRAIARKRNGWGMALGDIVLPEGRTVEQLVREAVTKSLNQSGYRVISREEAAGADVAQIDVDIKQLWAWMTPGFFTISLDFISEVDLKGNLPGVALPKTINGRVSLNSFAAGTGAWENTINKGVEDLITKTSTAVK